MEGPPAADADWSELPADILNTVLSELEFPDLFSSAAVCTTWRDTVRAFRHLGMYNRPQTPCLLYIAAATGTHTAELFSLADKKTYKARIPDPPIGERNIVGSSHGWLVTADGRSELHLLNPVTGEQIALPSVVTIEQVSPVFDHVGSLERYDLSFYYDTTRTEYETPQPYALDELRGILYRKVVLSCDPSQGNCTVMMIHEPYNQLSFARVGDNKWHWITTSFSNYSDCIFHDGAFYAMNLVGDIHRYTIGRYCATQDILFKDTSPFIAHNLYLCRSSSGNFLQILRYGTKLGEETEEIHTTSVFIHKVDFDKEGTADAHALGDDALFIGHNYTCCFSTKDYPRLLPNHVYFTDNDEYCCVPDSKLSRRDVGIYNLEAESVSDVVSPQKWLNWPAPVWITPSFNKIHK
jgi:hypothetical protein